MAPVAAISDATLPNCNVIRAPALCLKSVNTSFRILSPAQRAGRNSPAELEEITGDASAIFTAAAFDYRYEFFLL
jgi:hypothetical protein